MADASLDWPAPDGTGTQGDFGADATGDILCVNGIPESRQRIVRRWLTNPRSVSQADGSILPPDYIFDTAYGVGLLRLVGAAINPANTESLKQTCRDAMLQEEGVAQSPPPDVALTKIVGALQIAGSFTSATTLRPVALPRVTLT